MGAENPVRAIEDRVVGIRFRVKEAKRNQSSGEILLQCEVTDAALFDAIQRKLDGYKLFSDDMFTEIREALGDALLAAEATVQAKDVEIARLNHELVQASGRVDYVECLLAGIGLELGLGDG